MRASSSVVDPFILVVTQFRCPPQRTVLWSTEIPGAQGEWVCMGGRHRHVPGTKGHRYTHLTEWGDAE